MNQRFILLTSRLKRWTSLLLLILGCVLLTVFLLAFTTLPFWMYYHLGTDTAEYRFTPDKIVVLGGSGMPSESNLIRCYRAAELAQRFPGSPILIALPKNYKQGIYESAAYAMKQELMLRGVDSNRIQLEFQGNNTREQALTIRAQRSHPDEHLLVVTSPEHMYRSLLVFRKVGFAKVGGEAAFEKALEAELNYRDNKLGGRKVPWTDVGDELQLRYQFWNHLKYQVICYREYVALAYYSLRDWI